MKTSIIGGGAFGTAFATLLAENQHDVKLWCLEEDVSTSIKRDRVNSRYLPDVKLSSLIQPYTDIKTVLEDTQYVFIAVPVKHLRATLETMKPIGPRKLVLLCKGIEQGTNKFGTNKFGTNKFTYEIANEVLSAGLSGADLSVSVISGPNFAKELATGCYTASVVAGPDNTELSKLLDNSYFKLYSSSDVIGVSIAGAVKNVIALLMGLLSGYPENTKAYLLTMSLSEIVKLVNHFGGDGNTVYGLAGLGDLFLSCASGKGRNYKAGCLISEGKSAEELEALGMTFEGLNTVKSLYDIINHSRLDLPICKSVYEIIYDDKKVEDLLKTMSC